ncbi:hypothetical protein E3G69_000144 [Mycobacteroides abscessus]|nr:hypothetical protein [Mycobacteroides abscessus]QOF41134.1 hypothetical protein E3G69_000144 [Mycobacteroides abscessus]QOF45833.1 hypothetical protein E3G70_000143 [Mycobacteroides abscessus]
MPVQLPWRSGQLRRMAVALILLVIVAALLAAAMFSGGVRAGAVPSSPDIPATNSIPSQVVQRDSLSRGTAGRDASVVHLDPMFARSHEVLSAVMF